MTENATPEKTNRSLVIGLIVLGLTVVALVIALVFAKSPAGSDAGSPNAQATEQSEQADPQGAEPPADGAEPSEPTEQGGQGEASSSPEVPEAFGPVDPQLKELVESLWRLDADDPMAVGKVDADVVVQIYYDFRCGYCAKAATQTEPELKDLVDDGTVRIEYHNLPILGEDSVLLAQGAVAAGNQGKFVEYHSYVFDQQVGGKPVSATEDGIVDVAKEIGAADLEKFRADLTAKETVDAVAHSRSKATEELGITGTPAFLVGYSYVPGFVPADTMKQIISAELARPAQ